MADEQTLEQARTIYRGMVTLRKLAMARQLSSPEQCRMGGCDLTFAQFNMVMLVHERGQAKVKELAEALKVSPPSASAMVDRLVEMGVLTREQSQVDRREVEIRVAQGMESDIEALEVRVLGTIVDVLDKLGPRHARAWCDVNDRILKMIAEEDADAADTRRQRSGETKQ